MSLKNLKSRFPSWAKLSWLEQRSPKLNKNGPLAKKLAISCVEPTFERGHAGTSDPNLVDCHKAFSPSVGPTPRHDPGLGPLLEVAASSGLTARSPKCFHQHSKPPSTSRSTPVTNDAAGLNRKMAGPTISSTVAMRCIGVSRSKILRCSATSGRRFIGVSV